MSLSSPSEPLRRVLQGAEGSGVRGDTTPARAAPGAERERPGGGRRRRRGSLILSLLLSPAISPQASQGVRRLSGKNQTTCLLNITRGVTIFDTYWVKQNNIKIDSTF